MEQRVAGGARRSCLKKIAWLAALVGNFVARSPAIEIGDFARTEACQRSGAQKWHNAVPHLIWSVVMAERILLVDYENIQAVDLTALPDDVKVRFVFGSKQASLPSVLALKAHSMGERFSYVRIANVESNACDFCIACYLGEYLHANPNAECVNLSKDKKGFDPLVKHLTPSEDLRFAG